MAQSRQDAAPTVSAKFSWERHPAAILCGGIDLTPGTSLWTSSARKTFHVVMKLNDADNVVAGHDRRCPTLA